MIPSTAVELVKKFEGFSSKPYICPAGFWTIGYGHLCTKDHPPITKEEGEKLLVADLMDAYIAMMKLSPFLVLESEKRQGAIADFIYNLGETRYKNSTLRKRINERNFEAAAQEIRKWIYGGGKKLPGLVLRREMEAVLLNGE